ncbi:hypothetical protein PCE1_003692 [Barthelona sp. PCE]
MSDFKRNKRLSGFFNSTNHLKQLKSIVSFLESSLEVEQRSLYSVHYADIYSCFLSAIEHLDSRNKNLNVNDVLSYVGVTKRLLQYLPNVIRTKWQERSLLYTIGLVLKKTNKPKIRIAGLDMLLLLIDSLDDTVAPEALDMLMTLIDYEAFRSDCSPEEWECVEKSLPQSSDLDYTGSLVSCTRNNPASKEEASELLNFVLRFIDTRPVKRFSFYWPVMVNHIFPVLFGREGVGFQKCPDALLSPIAEYIVRWFERPYQRTIMSVDRRNVDIGLNILIQSLSLSSEYAETVQRIVSLFKRWLSGIELPEILDGDSLDSTFKLLITALPNVFSTSADMNTDKSCQQAVELLANIQSFRVLSEDLLIVLMTTMIDCLELTLNEGEERAFTGNMSSTFFNTLLRSKVTSAILWDKIKFVMKEWRNNDTLMVRWKKVVKSIAKLICTRAFGVAFDAKKTQDIVILTSLDTADDDWVRLCFVNLLYYVEGHKIHVEDAHSTFIVAIRDIVLEFIQFAQGHPDHVVGPAKHTLISIVGDFLFNECGCGVDTNTLPRHASVTGIAISTLNTIMLLPGTPVNDDVQKAYMTAVYNVLNMKLFASTIPAQYCIKSMGNFWHAQIEGSLSLVPVIVRGCVSLLQSIEEVSPDVVIPTFSLLKSTIPMIFFAGPTPVKDGVSGIDSLGALVPDLLSFIGNLMARITEHPNDFDTNIQCAIISTAAVTASASLLVSGSGQLNEIVKAVVESLIQLAKLSQNKTLIKFALRYLVDLPRLLPHNAPQSAVLAVTVVERITELIHLRVGRFTPSMKPGHINSTVIAIIESINVIQAWVDCAPAGLKADDTTEVMKRCLATLELLVEGEEFQAVSEEDSMIRQLKVGGLKYFLDSQVSSDVRQIIAHFIRYMVCYYDNYPLVDNHICMNTQYTEKEVDTNPIFFSIGDDTIVSFVELPTEPASIRAIVRNPMGRMAFEIEMTKDIHDHITQQKTQHESITPAKEEASATTPPTPAKARAEEIVEKRTERQIIASVFSMIDENEVLSEVMTRTYGDIAPDAHEREISVLKSLRNQTLILQAKKPRDLLVEEDKKPVKANVPGVDREPYDFILLKQFLLQMGLLDVDSMVETFFRPVFLSKELLNAIDQVDGKVLRPTFNVPILFIKEHQRVAQNIFKNDDVSLDFMRFYESLGEIVTIKGTDLRPMFDPNDYTEGKAVIASSPTCHICFGATPLITSAPEKKETLTKCTSVQIIYAEEMPSTELLESLKSHSTKVVFVICPSHVDGANIIRVITYSEDLRMYSSVIGSGSIVPTEAVAPLMRSMVHGILSILYSSNSFFANAAARRSLLDTLVNNHTVSENGKSINSLFFPQNVGVTKAPLIE